MAKRFAKIEHILKPVLMLEDTGDFKQMLARLEHATKQDPNDHSLKLWLAYVLRFVGYGEKWELEHAASILQDLANSAPEFRAVALTMLAHTLEQLNDADVERIVALLREATTIDPHLPIAHYNLARVLWKECSDPDAARAHVLLALANLMPEAQERELDQIDRTYESAMTGRIWNRRSILLEFQCILD